MRKKCKTYIKKFGAEIKSGTENKRVDKSNQSFLDWYDKNYSQFNLLPLEEQKNLMQLSNNKQQEKVNYYSRRKFVTKLEKYGRLKVK